MQTENGKIKVVISAETNRMASVPPGSSRKCMFNDGTRQDKLLQVSSLPWQVTVHVVSDRYTGTVYCFTSLMRMTAATSTVQYTPVVKISRTRHCNMRSSTVVMEYTQNIYQRFSSLKGNRCILSKFCYLDIIRVRLIVFLLYRK